MLLQIVLKYKLMRLKLIFLFFATLGVLSLSAQDHDHETHSYEHEDHENHDHHRNEIGIANSPVYFVKEKEFTYGLHIHYIYNIPNSQFGIGLGYERIFDEHKHQTYGIVGSYRPIDEWSINLSPGITFEGSETEEAAFAVHLETSYEFEINNFHIGPVLEFAYDPEDYHISLGLHVGYGF